MLMSGPVEISGRAIFPSEGAANCAIAWDVNFTFADGVRMQYRGTPNGYNTVNEMNDFRSWFSRYGKSVDHGTAFEGSEGWVMVHRGGLWSSPEELKETKFTSKDQRLPQSSNHVRNFLDAIKTGGATLCPIDQAVHADVLCHLSDIATRLPRKLRWDPIDERFVADEEANRKLALRPMREGWRWS